MYNKNIYCFRHGETDWNKEKRFQGLTDITLNETGRNQANSLIPIIAKLNIKTIYSSPLKRAVETANIIAKSLNLNVIKIDDLQEVNTGKASGLLYEEVDNIFGGGSFENWKSTLPEHDSFGFPDGETKLALRQRAVKTILDIAEHSSEQNFAVVTHGFFLKQLLLDLGSENHKGLKNAEVIHFTYNITKKDLQFLSRFTGPT
ncbi:MAG: histidine phosphatase family protein [Oligoflexia bacterium]|nr:histidine phosphatase family protein [Oligoflexia bacterium]